MALSKEDKRGLYEAGENDTYVEDILLESAGLFIKQNFQDKLSDTEENEAIEIYRKGFLGSKL